MKKSQAFSLDHQRKIMDIAGQDIGIGLEIVGFLLVLLVSGRNPKSGFICDESHKESKFDIIRAKIISDKYVSSSLIGGIACIILGLIFQLTPFAGMINIPTNFH